MKLVLSKEARLLDQEAIEGWGYPSEMLVEAAGRACWEVLQRQGFFTEHTGDEKIVVLVGSGNNGADALVVLKNLLFCGALTPASCAVVFCKAPVYPPQSVRDRLLFVVNRCGCPLYHWEEEKERITKFLQEAPFIIDGLLGTGVHQPISGAVQSLVDVVNEIRSQREAGKSPCIISIDIPSGLYDGWKAADGAVRADYTLAIEPLKACLFSPEGRKMAGTILPVTGIFPPPLLDSLTGGELQTFAEALPSLKKLASLPTNYKHERGVVEIYGGAEGTTGAPLLSARGAQYGGSGLVRLVVDNHLLPLVAPGAGGIMVVSQKGARERPLATDVMVVGPGWGNGPERASLFSELVRERPAGTGLVIDADALRWCENFSYGGKAVCTPHVGEMEQLLIRLNERSPLSFPQGKIVREMLLSQPLPLLQEVSRRLEAVILFKSHILWVVAPDGRWSVIDGLVPVLAMGGTGDVLAGLVGAVMARIKRQTGGVDPYQAAVIAGLLLMEAGKTVQKEGFCDPTAVVAAVGKLAGSLWLSQG
ncbi:bifunctional ADP-dependent NAD(P)H-hydrate dehydratase/NAD(P)H-hydrate epimerase [Treponema sp. J25]|uniref:NAD(P)H-hydrate epimerase n=1 Tax=Treponema sp. J25 TaxID=2094121 RepID=UPI001049F938|nr:bifunctional ADP-dependent NAD(P)H-hydrate dehydratase/NAD(P)H-hydrate epimerase [Treponema sp. J25]TCW60762.1 hypothetical protein C5O22_09845 [Treponema sp. J25]